MRTVSILSLLYLSGCGLTPLAGNLVVDEGAELPNLGGLEASSGIIDFGTVEPDNIEFQDLVLTNTSVDTLVIADAFVDGDTSFLIDTMTLLPTEIEPGLSEIITLSFSPSDELDYSADLNIQLEDASDLMQIEMLGSGDISEDSDTGTDSSLIIDTVSIDFGEVNTYSSTMEQVTITNSGEDDVLIRNVTSTDSSYGYSGDLVPPTVMSGGSSKSFFIVFEPMTEGDFPASITIETDINEGTNFEFEVNGTAVEPDCEICTPNIQVNTPSGDDYLMNFLSVYNLPDEQLLSIQNMSDVDMTISDAYLSNDTQGGDFTLAFSPVTLGPWETTSAVVTFQCPELCFEYPNGFSDTNVLHILSDDPTEPDYQIELWTGF